MTSRWIESVQPLLVLPANPSEWTAQHDEAVRELLNGDAVQALLAAWVEYEAQRQTQKVEAAS